MEKQKKKLSKEPPTVSTDLFKDKVVPPFLKEHALFRTTPTKIQKIFPSIGLPNFIDKVNIERSFVDLKKENSYVHAMLRTINDIISRTKNDVSNFADKLQFLSTKEEREANRSKLIEMSELSNILFNLIPATDPYDLAMLNEMVIISESKISLKLPVDIVNGNGKVVFKRGVALFSLLNKIKEKCAGCGLAITNVEQTEAFKTFSKENIPNKEFSIIFSSEGNQGAWDIATMSMRGIKSCQRWDGEYPRCLVGSILSKFVGIIYLTSGVQADNYGAYKDLGTKMIRRCVVRYAVDVDEGKPCILIDKMYPEHDKDILAIFTKSLQNRTKLPVHYAPELGNRTKHLYLPSEKVRERIADRDWSYQDTPLKTKTDIQIYVLSTSKEELERDTKGFVVNFPLFLARKMDSIYSGYTTVDEEVKRTITNMRMNNSFTQIASQISQYLMTSFKAPDSKNYNNNRKYYREYLFSLLRGRKSLQAITEGSIMSIIQQNTSRVVNKQAIMDFILSSLVEFIKLETKRINN